MAPPQVFMRGLFVATTKDLQEHFEQELRAGRKLDTPTQMHESMMRLVLEKQKAKLISLIDDRSMTEKAYAKVRGLVVKTWMSLFGGSSLT